ncbi:hypothetical protein D9758_003149 [Tetrapyrgos nigripes]|uniref:Ran guanine nucleotide release factor n=1 Tax=Tetrapyrgos nigripes TaxID=182062 RepID=A0A8H5GJ38_9AGAR|nr:hypothetical protein D9758_003149 [Tetrapyrgos nigripes]
MSLQLFGGAITADAPASLIDASDLRQVPDTQEVFLFPDSSISIVIEVLQKVEPTDFADAVKFHFDSLAHDNSAASSQVFAVTTLPNDRGDATPSAVLLSGVQFVTKFNRTTPDQVRILMALYRVEDKGIDLVVTFNIPVSSQDGGAVDLHGFDVAQQQFNAFVRSLKIVDFSLFT